MSASNATILPTSALRSHADKELLLDIDNVGVTLGGDKAIDQISFCVHSGEFIGIIGPNGAGKTTLLRTMLGLQKPSRGTITRPHVDVMGYVPQRGNLYNGQIPISVLEVVTLGSRGSNTQARQALESVSMLQYAGKPFIDLSGGQQQRVAIAKALASNPNILLLDEPTTGIDESSQQEFYGILRNLQAHGLTIVMVSHDVDAVLNLVTRVICLTQTILYDGAPEHFESDKYLPSLYKTQHRLLHHHHGGTHA
ncbi:MAG: metal ABC transporter ATP-binding protein [Candidatus Saccharibacteria bacterium]